jgi:hypothetical protein
LPYGPLSTKVTLTGTTGEDTTMTAATATATTFRDMTQPMGRVLLAPAQPRVRPLLRVVAPAQPVAPAEPVVPARSADSEQPVAPGISVRMLGLRSTSNWLGIRVADLGVVAEARARADVALCPLCRRQHDWDV